MQVPRGTDLRAALIAARLLESEGMDFYSVLQPSEHNLEFYGSIGHADDDLEGQLEIWWTAEIEARRWGIKDIIPFVSKLVLDVTAIDIDRNEAGKIHYEYPEAAQPKAEIGPDPDAPTPDNVMHLADPKWKVDYGVDPHSTSRTHFSPHAEVRLDKRIIKILF